MTDPMDGWLSKETCDAMEGDRAAALALWRQVAAGVIDDDTRAWVQHVATQLLRADKTKQRRPTEIMAAVGLAGKLETSQALREAVETFYAFEDLDKKPQRGTGTRMLIKTLRDAGLVPAHLGDEEIRKRIEYALRK